MVTAQNGDPPTFNIYGTTLGITTKHTSQTHNRLLRYRNQNWPENAKVGELTIVGDLAESWTITENGTLISIKLRRGVKWHNVAPLNGRELTSDDIIGSFDRLDNHPKSVFKGQYTDVIARQATDRYTVTFKLNKPLASFMHRLADGEASWIGSKEYIDHLGDKYGVNQDSFVGTGPFLKERGEPGARYTYIKNPNFFWQPYPHLDAWHRLIIPDASAREAAFVTGQIDEYGASQLAQAQRINNQVKGSRFNRTTLTSGDAGGFTMNMDLPKWKDFKVRQAIAYAVNHDRVIKDLWAGEGYYDSCIPVGLSDYALTQEELKKYRVHDPVKAKALLAEAGYGAAGSLAIELMTFSTQDLHIQVAEAWAADLTEVGAKVTLRPLQINQGRELVRAGNFDAVMTTHSTSSEPDDAFSGFVPGEPTNYMRLNDPKVTAWYEQQTVEYDNKKRIQILREFDAYCNANISGIVVMPKRNGFNLQQEWLKNFEPGSGGDEPGEMMAWIDKGPKR